MSSPRMSARQSLRRIALTIALLLGSFTALAGTSVASTGTLVPLADAGGAGGSGAATAAASFILTANERSIALIEGRDPENAGIVFIGSPPATTHALAPAGLGQPDINFCIPCDGMA